MFNIHRKYLFSKINIIVLILIIFIAIICYLANINISFDVYEKWLNRKESIINFYNTSLFLTKFIGVMLASFIIGSAFSKNLDNYAVLFLNSRKNRFKYFITKILTLYFVVSFSLILINLIGLSLYSISSHSFFQYIDFFKQNLYIITLSLVYGSISSIIVQLLITQLGVIVPFVLFIMVEALDTSTFSNFLNIILPNISINVSLNLIIHNIFLLILYTFLSFLIYYKKDIC